MVLIKVAAVELEVEREVVAGAGGDAGDDSQRAVAAGDAEGVRTARHRLFDQRRQACTRGLPAPDFGLRKSTGLRFRSTCCCASSTWTSRCSVWLFPRRRSGSRSW